MFEDSNVVIYTDGSSLIKGDYYESSGAIIITVDGKEVYRYGEYFPNGTNSKGEVYAMMFAYDTLHELFNVGKLKSITIICDSEYVVNSVTKWIYGWKKAGWTTSSGEAPKFCEVFMYLYEKYLDKSIKNNKIKVYHINSHRKDTVKARRKFQFKNNVDVTQKEYDEFTYWNNKVDEFANQVRDEKKNIKKSIFTNEYDSIEKPILSLTKRNGRILINSRKRKDI